MNTEEILEKSRKIVAEIHRTMAVIERCDALAGIIKDMDFVFADPERKDIVDVYPVLSDTQKHNLKSMIIGSITLNREDAEKQLLKITGSEQEKEDDCEDPDSPEADSSGGDESGACSEEKESDTESDELPEGESTAADENVLPEKTEADDLEPIEPDPVIPESFRKKKGKSGGKEDAVPADAEDRITRIRKMVNDGMTQADIAQELNISAGRVCQLIKQHNITKTKNP